MPANENSQIAILNLKAIIFDNPLISKLIT